MSDSVSSGLP